MAIVKFENVSKVYSSLFSRNRIKALDNVSFSIERNGIFGILGPNGAGKTTLLKILLGLVIPTSGKVEILGSEPSDPEVRKEIGYMPEEFSPPEFLTGMKVLKLTAEIFGLDKNRVKDAINKYARLLNIDEWLGRNVSKYSKGMKQKLGIIRALLNDGKILVFDEPLNNVDILGRREIIDILKELKKDRVILYSTHIIAEAIELCDEIFLIKDGKIINNLKISEERDFFLLKIEAWEGFKPESEICGITFKKFGKYLGCIVSDSDSEKLNFVISRLRENGVKFVVEKLKIEKLIEIAFSE